MPTDSTHDVAAEMERIFAPLAGRSVQVPANPAIVRNDDVPPPRPARRGLLFVAPLLVLLTGGALASIYIVNGGLPTASAPRMVAASPTTAANRDAGTGTGDELATVDSSLSEDSGEADATEPQSVPAEREAIAPGDPPFPAAPVAGVRRRDRVEAGGTDGEVRSAGGASQSRTQCEPGSLDDQCIYQDVLSADGRLRRAFDRARRGGVPSGRLTTIQRQWILARDNADDDPDGTIRRYDRLADILDQERDEVVE
jgi:hypothetical protein